MARPNKALILDDERDICQLLKTMLEKKGYDVVSSYSLEEGKKKFEAFEPNVLFLDINLPDGNGLDQVPTFQRLNKKTHIIIISARDSADELKRAEEYHIRDFIRKPFDRKTIEEALQDN